ncbi:MAG: GTP 3',8-cyclase MoaA [Gammaproteobacteria bacterium]|nr:GTP 3',8-cyclase MoaA [Gammaproteobacteria bacterium]
MTSTDPGKIVDQLGRPARDLRISVLDRCNFRCPYCMPEDQFPEGYQFLTRQQWLSFDEIERLSRIFIKLGVSKLRITGGEPLLRPDLPELIARLIKLEGIDDLALTTNGALLARMAGDLAAAGLHRVTVSLDSLDNEVFSHMSGGRGSLAQVLEGIEAAASQGLGIKINTVVQRGINDHTLLDLLEHFRGSGHIVRFIEFMDVGTLNHWDLAKVVPARELRDLIHARWPLVPLDHNYHGEVAKRYNYADGAGEIGFITSVTEPFCGNCNRARLSADGEMFTCLFANRGTDLKGALRAGASDEQLLELIGKVWLHRSDRYSSQRSTGSAGASEHDRVEMYHIGG